MEANSAIDWRMSAALKGSSYHYEIPNSRAPDVRAMNGDHHRLRPRHDTMGAPKTQLSFCPAGVTRSPGNQSFREASAES